MRQSTLARKVAFGAALLAGASSVHAATQAVPLPVRVQVTGSVAVTNTPANPVPVSGSVNLNGTPTVKLNGAVVIDNSVSLRVRDADSAARQPFQASGVVFLADGVPASSSAVTTVPPGKMFVIETVDARVLQIVGTNGIARLSISTCLGGECLPHHIALERQGQSNSPVYAAATAQVRFYAEPGSYVTATLERSPQANSASAEVNLTGHFVDVQP